MREDWHQLCSADVTGRGISKRLFSRAMSQAAALARIFGECREAKYPAPWGQKNKLGQPQLAAGYLAPSGYFIGQMG